MTIVQQRIFILLLSLFCTGSVESFAQNQITVQPEKQKSEILHTPINTDWGEIRFLSTGLELHVIKPSPNGRISIPRLNNPIEAVYLKNDKQKKPLTLKAETTSWIISLPKSSVNTDITVMVKTKGQPHIPKRPRVMKQSADGSITFPAHEGVTHGKMLRYEPQPHKNTIGYWVNVKDWCEWHCQIEQPGRFEVHVLQGCGTGQGGSNVAVTIGKQKVRFTVEETGHFQNFKDRIIGSVILSKSSKQTLQIRPISKAAKAIMDVRQVRLILVREK
jgi:hypothetical protein